MAFKDTKHTITTTSASSATVDTTTSDDGVKTHSIKMTGAVSSTPVLMQTKVFSTATGLYYAKKPIYKINSQYQNRLVINEKDLVFDTNNRILSITFEIYYVFTNQKISTFDGESITFSVDIKAIPAAKATKEINIVPSGSISISESKRPHRIKITGDEGAKFQWAIQNLSGQYFDFNGSFSSTPIYVTGYIPTAGRTGPIEPGSEEEKRIYTKEITFNATTSADSYTVIVVPAGEDVKIKSKYVGGREIDVPTSEIVIEEQPEVAIIFAPICTEPGVGALPTATLDVDKFGPFKQNSLIEEELYFAFEWKIPFTGLDEDGINYLRNGEFSAAADIVVDGGSDWNNTVFDDNNGWRFHIYQTYISGTASNLGIKVTGSIEQVGTANITSQLNVNNLINTTLE